jgi:hypothetical protein
MHDRIGFSIGSMFAAVIPLACGIFGALIANMPISIFGGHLPPPLLALMPVYFWCLVRPDLMPPWVAFAIGILEDLLSGGPPGVWAAAFVASYALVDRQRESFAGLVRIRRDHRLRRGDVHRPAPSPILIAAFYYWRFPPISMPIVRVRGHGPVLHSGAAFLNLIHRRLVGPLRSDF